MKEPDCSQQAYAEEKHDYEERQLEDYLYKLAGFLFESIPEARHVPNEEIIRLVDEFRENGRLK